jgi:hypothetical protein
MENQTRFDLNAAVENWRSELTAQPPLTSENRRELETHLRDALTELKARGLSDEESFWLARRRVGQPQKLAEEFAKADPTKVWRERVFWMWLALFLSCTLEDSFKSLTWLVMPKTPLHDSAFWLRSIIQTAILLIPILAGVFLVMSLAKGKFVSQFSRLMLLLAQRRLLAIAVFACIILSFAVRLVDLEVYYLSIVKSLPNMPMPILQMISPFLYMVIVGFILIWLAPEEKQTKPKNA